MSRSEVDTLAAEGYLQEQICFGNNSLVYALQVNEDQDVLSADFTGNTITMYAPGALIKNWPLNDIVGFDARMPLADNGNLYLLLEKDFVCLDATSEDQSDNYENPNKTC